MDIKEFRRLIEILRGNAISRTTGTIYGKPKQTWIGEWLDEGVKQHDSELARLMQNYHDSTIAIDQYILRRTNSKTG